MTTKRIERNRLDKGFEHAISVEHSIAYILAHSPDWKKEIDPFHIEKVKKFKRIRSGQAHVRASKEFYSKLCTDLRRDSKIGYIKFIKGIITQPKGIPTRVSLVFDIGGAGKSVLITWNLETANKARLRLFSYIYDTTLSNEERFGHSLEVKTDIYADDLYSNDFNLIPELVKKIILETWKYVDSIPVFTPGKQKLENATETVIEAATKSEDKPAPMIIEIAGKRFTSQMVKKIEYELKEGELYIYEFGEMGIVATPLLS